MRTLPPPNQFRSSEPSVSLPYQSKRNADMTCVFAVPLARVKNATTSFCPSEPENPVRIRIDDGMHADADTRRLGDVLEQVHLLAVETNSIDLVALPPERVKHTVFLHLRRDAVDQDVLAALGRVDELEAFTRVGRRERGQMVRYGTAVAIVPVFDPGHRLTAGKVLHLGSATQLCRRQPDIIAQCPDTPAASSC